MEHRFFNNVEEVASYLNLSPEDIRQRVKCHEIPFEARGKRMVFDKNEIDLWASRSILNLTERRLADYHQKSTAGTSAFLNQPAILPQMLQREFIALAMTGKTKASILRDLVDLADQTGRLNDPKALRESLAAREELCSTAMPGGFALPHPCSHDDYLFESSFIVVGRSLQPINFGAPDGQPTNLFFLVCSQDDRLHLHTLARLCFMVQNTNLLAEINSAADAEIIYHAIIGAELAATTAR